MRWCGTRARSSAEGLAVPMSSPRYTCIESTETISPPSCSARSNAMLDFPTAVGPASRIGPGWRLGAIAIWLALSAVLVFHGTEAREDRPRDSACGEYPDADQLGGRQSAVKMDGGVIAAKCFDDRTRHRVAHQVGGEDLAVEFFRRYSQASAA